MAELEQELGVDGSEKVEIGGIEVSLSEIAGIDLDEVKELRVEPLPRGLYTFATMADDDTKPQLQVMGGKAAAIFRCVVKDVISLVDNAEAPEGDPLQLIGKQHREAFFFTDLESIGYCKAFMKDLGGSGSGKFAEQLAALSNVIFNAPITHRKDKNDADRTFVNIDRNKVKFIEKLEDVPAAA